MRESESPVILIGDIEKEIREKGAWIEVQCIQPPKKAAGTYRGEWRVLVCTPKGSDEVTRAVLVISRGLASRVFKTPIGLLSFGMEFDLRTFRCPLRKGAVEAWDFETSEMPVAD